MSKNQAIVVEKPKEAKVKEVTIPKLRDDYILVKVKAVALNPTDWKHVDYLSTEGARIGCDYAGIVEEIGSKVTKDFKKGDRVCGFVHGGNEANHDDGCFGNYTQAKGDIQIKIPENLSFEEAATLGVGITTVGQGLYQSLKLALPTKPTTAKEQILIYGGSTSTGTLAIQFAHLSGYTVLTTSSPQHHAYLKSLGASHCFDYKSPTCAQDIKSASKDSLKLVFDCISEGSSPQISVESMSSEGGVYSTLLNVTQEKVNEINPRVEMRHTLGYTVIGETFPFGPKTYPASGEDFEFGKMFWEMSRRLLGEGKVKTHRHELDRGGEGLEGVLAGMEELRQGRVSGIKLVYKI
ncbi:chaperonin 10-like protein [Tricladium varicosporioides]|nr:chaperonin 10-like protein [Hymenoscyphus varicosporioides]